MNDEWVRLIIKRIDTLEGRVMGRLISLEKSRARAYGGLAVIAFLVPLLIDILRHL